MQIFKPEYGCSDQINLALQNSRNRSKNESDFHFYLANINFTNFYMVKQLSHCHILQTDILCLMYFWCTYTR